MIDCYTGGEERRWKLHSETSSMIRLRASYIKGLVRAVP